MNVIGVIVIVGFVGFIAWLVSQVEMPPIFRNLIVGLLVFFVIAFILQSLGVNTGLPVLHLR